jgi:hypothetical protein
MNRLITTLLAITIAVVGASAQTDYTKSYVLHPWGVNMVTLGRSIDELPATLPQIYSSKEVITDGNFIDGKMIKMEFDNPVFPVYFVRVMQYHVIGSPDRVEEKQLAAEINWEAVGGNANKLEDVIELLEPPSIEYYSGRSMTVSWDNGQICIIYIYSPRFKTAEHGLCATSSLWDLYNADADLVITKSGLVYLEADGVRFFGYKTTDDDGDEMMTKEYIQSAEFQEQFGNNNELRYSFRMLNNMDDLDETEKSLAILTLQTMHMSYIVIDKWHKPKGYYESSTPQPRWRQGSYNLEPYTFAPKGDMGGLNLNGEISATVKEDGEIVGVNHTLPGYYTRIRVAGGVLHLTAPSSSNTWYGSSSSAVGDKRTRPEYRRWRSDIPIPVPTPPAGVVPAPAPEKPAGIVVKKDQVGPVKMGINYEQAQKELEKIYRKIWVQYDDMQEAVVITCFLPEDDDTQVMTIYCDSKNKVSYYYIHHPSIKTEKGLSVDSTYEELIKAGGRWESSDSGDYVVLDGLYFWFFTMGEPDAGSTPAMISNVGFLSA